MPGNKNLQRAAKSAFSMLLATWLVLFASCTQIASRETTTPVPSSDEYWVQRNQKINEQSMGGAIDLVFLGDSITDLWLAKPYGKEIWDQYYGGRNAADFGINGDKIQYVLWRIQHGNFDGIDPRLIVLLIGTNNLRGDSIEDIAAGIIKIVFTLRMLKPAADILLLGIFPRGQWADNPMRSKIDQVNSLLAPLGRLGKITYLDIGHVFLDARGAISPEIMTDYLHPTTQGYRLWAEAIEPTLRVLLQE